MLGETRKNADSYLLSARSTIYIYINMEKTKNRLKRKKEGDWEGFLYIYGYVNKDEAVGRNAMTN